MNLLREYIRELAESEYRRIQDDSDQCTNATVLAIAHYFGDEVPPDACIGHITGADMQAFLKKDMGYRLENEYGWLSKATWPKSQGGGYKTTLKKFIEDHPTGVYYISSNRHAMALIDSELVDTAEFRRLGRVKVINAVRVEK